jgi:mono/diheme cytochrome c family protein
MMHVDNFTRNPAIQVSRFAGLMLAVAIVVHCGFPGTVMAQEGERTTYEDHVKQILRQRCASCHSPQKKSGDLDVTDFGTLMQGGSSGTVIEPGDADSSYLIGLIKHDDEPVMPPGGKIPDEEINLIVKWVNEGAPLDKGSKVIAKKKSVAAASADPLVRPEVVAMWPRIPLEPVQYTAMSPAVRAIAVSPWAPVAAIGGQNQVLLYDTNTLQLTGVLPFSEGTVNRLAFSRNGSILIAGGGQHGNRGVAVLWDVASGERIGTVGDEIETVLAADISADHTKVALGGPGRLVKVYDVESGNLLYSINKHTDWVTAIEFSPDGVLLASGDRNGGLYVFEAVTGREYLTLKGHEKTITEITWRNDSNVVCSSCEDTTIRLWEMNNGAQIKSWNAHGGGVKSVRYLRDGRIVSTGNDRIPRLWDGDGNKLLDFPAVDDLGLSVAWCNESGRCISGDFPGTVRVWNGADGVELAKWTPNPPTLALRLEQANTAVAARQAELQPVLAELAVASDQANQAVAVLETHKQELAVAAAKLAELQSALTAATEMKSASESRLGVLQSDVQTRSTARDLIRESLVKLQEALNALPGDAELLQQSQTIAARIASFDTEINSMNSELQQVQSTIAESSSQVVAATAEMPAKQATLAELEMKVKQASETLAPLVARRDEIAARVATLQAAEAQAIQEQGRWQAEMAFIARLQELRTLLAAAEQEAAGKQAALDNARAALAEQQKHVDAAQGDMNKSLDKAGSVQAEIDALRQRNN